MDLIVTYKKAFSLRDEIGKCPDIKVNMQKLVSLGILTKNSTTHTSPVMLVARKEMRGKDQLLTLGYCILG